MRTLLIAIVLVTSRLAAEEPKKPAPPDRKAYMETLKVSDPRQKIEALRKFIADYPKSTFANSANDLILQTLAKSFSYRTHEIREQAELILKNVTKSTQAAKRQQVADTFADNGVLLKWGEELARTALKQLKEKNSIEEEMKYYRKSKEEPPDKETFHQHYQLQRARFLATLGKIYLKEGDSEEGERLLKEAYAASPALSSAALQLGILAGKAGNYDVAFAYLVQARLTGVLTPAYQKWMQDLYRRNHADKPDGLDEFLDETYRKKFPEPIHVEPYKADASRSGRVVLAEIFTGSGCPPCAGADLAMDAAMERYSRQDLAVLMFHQHVPRPDPMANPAAIKRASFYDAQGMPTLAIDGKTAMGGADRSGTKRVYDRVNSDIEKELRLPAEAHLTIAAAIKDDTVKVHVTVDEIKSDSKDLKLQIALVEQHLRYGGESGIRFHPMVVRATAAAFAIAKKTAAFDYVFDIARISSGLEAYLKDYEVNNDRFGKITFAEKKNAIDPSDLAVVAFVQDDKNKKVLQAGYLKVEKAP
jgi:tetratricopeptide (TPR) repeat protein